MPRVLDSEGKALHVPNVDYWLNNKTGKQYSYRMVIDMAAAFRAGTKISYRQEEVFGIIDVVVKNTIKEITRKHFLYEYALSFWIEALGEEDIEKKLIAIRDNFQKIKESISKSKLKNELLRFYKASIYRQSKSIGICEEIITHNNMTIEDPVYPETNSIDEEIMNNIKECIAQEVPKLRGMSDHLADRIEYIRQLAKCKGLGKTVLK